MNIVLFMLVFVSSALLTLWLQVRVISAMVMSTWNVLEILVLEFSFRNEKNLYLIGVLILFPYIFYF